LDQCACAIHDRGPGADTQRPVPRSPTDTRAARPHGGRGPNHAPSWLGRSAPTARGSECVQGGSRLCGE
ncbi:hypothetical protein P5780_27690, partial [Bacillus cereus]